MYLMDQQVGFVWSTEAGTRKRSTKKSFAQSTNVEEQEEKGRSQGRFCAEHKGPGTGVPRKEPRRVLRKTPRLRNRSTKKGTEEGFVRSTGVGGTNKHQKKKPAHNWSKGVSQKK
jgi:hypothetical protein